MRSPAVDLVLMVMVAHWPATLMAGAPRPAEFSREQVLTRLRESHDRIRAFSVEYQAAAGILPFYNHRTVAARFPDSCYHLGAKASAPLEWRTTSIDDQWRDDPYQNWVLVTSSDCRWGVPFARVYGEFPLARDARLPAKLHKELIFAALGWWPFENRPGPQFDGGGRCVIPEILESPQYLLAPQQELSQGRWCHVLEFPGCDRLWLDYDRGCSILARETYDPGNGAASQRFELSEQFEVAPGIWAPRQILNTQFDCKAAAPADRARHVLQSMIRIVDVRLNDNVDPALFAPPPLPPGALQRLNDGSYQQVVPGGYELMDSVADWLVGVKRFERRDALSVGDVLDLAVLGVAAAALAVFYMLPLMTRRNTPTNEKTTRLAESLPPG